MPLIPGTYDALSWTAESAKEDPQVAPPKAGGTDHGFPVIVFSHGSVDLPIDYYITLERIAAQGFIVAAPAHVNNTSDDARIDYLNAAANRTVLPCFDSLPSVPPTCALPTIPVLVSQCITCGPTSQRSDNPRLGPNSGWGTDPAAAVVW